MGEHALISGQVRQALEGGRVEEAAQVTAQISELLNGHSRDEEAGLFALLRNSDLGDRRTRPADRGPQAAPASAGGEGSG